MEQPTLEELAEMLRSWEETALMDVLQLNSSDIVDRFMDVIENRYEELVSELEEITTDETEGTDF